MGKVWNIREEERSRRKIAASDSQDSLREFHAQRVGEKWVSDITYLRTCEGWVYLTIIVDLYDRNVIGWSFSDYMGAEETTVAALCMAFARRKALEGLLFHSDCGVQYCAGVFRDMLLEKCPAARQSMSRKGNCWDNACAESFFKTLKSEVGTLEGKDTAAEVRESVFMYIEAYYNRVRAHSALDYVSPDVFYLKNTLNRVH